MTEKLYGWGLPVNVSAHGADIDRLIWIIHGFMLVLFVGWSIFFIVVLVKFRARPGRKADYHGRHFKLPTAAEVFVAIFEIVLLFALAFPIWNRTRQSFDLSTNPLIVRVIAEQFAWNVHYPGPDGIFGRTRTELMGAANPTGLDPDDPAGKDDITTVNQLVVPVDRPVAVRLSSKDVIHSFGIPVMRVKQDAIPGQSIDVYFQAKRTGDFEIVCSQLCGLGHYRMRGFFIVKTKEEFQAWLDERHAERVL
ncbi:MAG: hypothetical protein A3D28_02915 [Omnitrophica bacterium RIFCSPHIGHO2_02_FULL_63_14]|nr:MAG: hypothetical protein A3D28_02915 [Omnitrophica bacterium RIFCSPHIGHO2_02_FULL_63_14]